jgi:heptose I phosphotransferase
VPTGAGTADPGWRGFAAREPRVADWPHDFEELDAGRLRIKNRSTVRIALSDGSGFRWFYLKRHERPRWGERLRPLLNFGKPVFGARNEWLAILGLRDAGVPTLTPVRFGEQGDHSLLVTEDLRTDITLLHWVNRYAAETASSGADSAHVRALIGDLARLTRRTHGAGIFRQDFFLNHILTRGEPGRLDMRVIDPGRALRQPRFRRRWIIKDLAQLEFSARCLPCADRLRFLRLYLERPFRRSDRFLVRLIAVKSRRTASHTAKHSLWVPGDPEAADACDD